MMTSISKGPAMAVQATTIMIGVEDVARSKPPLVAFPLSGAVGRGAGFPEAPGADADKVGSWPR
jgi:hypothetical protein